MSGRPKIAFLFRYGAGEHAELFHTLPEVLRRLGEAGVGRGLLAVHLLATRTMFFFALRTSFLANEYAS